MKTIVRVVLLCLLLAPLLSLSQDVLTNAPATVANAPPVVDPLLSDIAELVQHAKLGRTVLAILAGVILVVRLVLRFGSRIPGAVGAWLGGPVAAIILPAAIGLLGGIITTVANGGAWYDGLIGGLIIAFGAWLPVKPVAPPVAAPPAEPVNTSADAVNVFRKGPNP